MKRPFWMMGIFAVLLSCTQQQQPQSDTAQTLAGCGNEINCQIGERGYAAKPPDGWNGVDPLPVLIHFHGWGRQGRHIVRHKRVAPATNETGVLLLAPDGLLNTWLLSSRNDRDIRFTEAVLADAERRWPIDRSKVFLSGYSYGSIMALHVACDGGDKYAGFLGISGLLHQASPTNCDTGPVNIRNVHGLRDNVLVLPIQDENDPAHAMLPWAAISNCDTTKRTETKVTTVRPIKEYTEYRWTDCENGTQVQIDVHGRGHFIPKGWIKRQLEDLLARS